MIDLQRLKEKLINLRLKTMAQDLDAILEDANKKNTDFLSIPDGHPKCPTYGHFKMSHLGSL